MEEDGPRVAVRMWEAVGPDVTSPEVLDLLRHEVLDRITALPGYLGHTLLADVDRSAVCAISYWCDLASMEASDREAGRTAEAFLALTAPESITRSHYLVIDGGWPSEP